MKRILLSLALILLASSGCNPQEKQELETEPVSEMETSPLLSLDPNSPECTEAPFSGSNDMGGKFTNYPVADEYETSADDYHRIASLFTAAACGETRLEELFGAKTYQDVAIFTESPSSGLIDYLKGNGFVCSDDTLSDEECDRWIHEGIVSLEVLSGLREWADMIYGSDCTNCG